MVIDGPFRNTREHSLFGNERKSPCILQTPISQDSWRTPDTRQRAEGTRCLHRSPLLWLGRVGLASALSIAWTLAPALHGGRLVCPGRTGLHPADERVGKQSRCAEVAVSIPSPSRYWTSCQIPSGGVSGLSPRACDSAEGWAAGQPLETVEDSPTEGLKRLIFPLSCRTQAERPRRSVSSSPVADCPLSMPLMTFPLFPCPMGQTWRLASQASMPVEAFHL